MGRSDGTTGGPAQPTWRDQFNRLSDRLTAALGSAWALLASVLLVVGWALTGPLFGYADTWQLFINTVTTVITFWMVFVIQNSQNRDARAIHLKLDEIIRANEAARNEFIVAEKATEAEISARETELHELVEESVRDGMDRAGTGASGNGASGSAASDNETSGNGAPARSGQKPAGQPPRWGG